MVPSDPCSRKCSRGAFAENDDSALAGDVALHEVLPTAISGHVSMNAKRRVVYNVGERDHDFSVDHASIADAPGFHRLGRHPTRQPCRMTHDGKRATYLVNHIGNKTLHLVTLQQLAPLLPHPQPNRSAKLRNRHARPAYAIRLRLALLQRLVSARDEHFAQQVTQRDVAAALERQVNAALDELGFACCERRVEAREVAALDACCEGREEALEAWVRGEEGGGGKGVGG